MAKIILEKGETLRELHCQFTYFADIHTFDQINFH